MLDIKSIRSTFEEFLDVWGLDFNNSKLWDLYIDFEKGNIAHFAKNSDEINYCQTSNLLRSLYRRRLSFPRLDLDLVWKEYSKWEEDNSELKKTQEKYKQVNFSDNYI